MKISRTILFFTIPIAFSACNSSDNQKRSDTSSDTLRYTYQNFYLASKHLVDNDGKKDTTYFKAIYPTFENQEINQVVTRHLISDTLHQSFEEEAKAFIQNFDDFINMDEYPRAWYSESRTKVIQNTPHYLALSTEINDYTGGAHGNYGTLFFNYEPTKKDTIGLADIVPLAKQDTLTAIAGRIFRKQEGLAPDQSLDDAYFFEDNTFHLNTNFTLTPKGLLFLYNVYEIKPYASGITELLIPYEQLDSIITPEAKLIRKQLK
ncbi:hypothetical protein GCM10023231_20680 [Olivibacter ginsenosidimutans]|uniref:DUF3298 and DUF4163 domain-containing protein n=1 Tax=Olivibacter ginsenosidimutans TaxID=1176537 RepID=A0ABP9B967_9SPHI